MLKTAMKVRKKRTKTPALTTAIVFNGRVYFTDMDMSASVPTTLADGFYNPDTLLNGLTPQLIDCGNVTLGDVLPEWGDDYTPRGNVTLDRDTLAFLSRATGQDDVRYFLCGIYFGQEHIVATDGHRMHYVANNISLHHIVPNKMIDIILSSKAKSITLQFFGQCVRCHIDDLILVSKCINGTFPDYQRIIPDITSAQRYPFSASEIATAYKIVKPLLPKKSPGYNPVHSCYVTDSLLHWTGIEQPQPIATTRWPSDTGFSAPYLIDTSLDNATLHWTGPLDPALISKDNLTAIIMPVRI